MMPGMAASEAMSAADIELRRAANDVEVGATDDDAAAADKDDDCADDGTALATVDDDAAETAPTLDVEATGIVFDDVVSAARRAASVGGGVGELRLAIVVVVGVVADVDVCADESTVVVDS